MSLFFDASWFDARLSEKGLDRAGLAAAANLDRAELHCLYTNQRSPAGEELAAFAAFLGADLLEVTLRAGVSSRATEPGANPTARIEDIEARLDAIDTWLAEFESAQKRA